ncbi:MAG: S41 family peptidase [Dysgonamonadaceae bacterium]|jgi:carboxyl-terminal processing protease|nr:S41 family peptidase [Dysgonamonadaceae bacterium]
MKQLAFACLLIVTMNACTYGQNGITFGRVASSAAAQKVNMALTAVENLYVDELDGNKLAEDAIVGLLEKLDPHSNYMTPEEVKEMNEPLQGNFDGIGIQFNMLTDTLYVIQVIPGGPSEKVGILAGDRIIRVNDTLIAGVKMKNTDVMSRLRGPKGTAVNVKVLRNKDPKLLNFKIIRDKIPIYSLDASYMVDKTTGYIKLNRFSATTHDEFKTALDKLMQQGMQNLILDLQNNGGGYLGAAIEIANEFLKQGSLIVYTEGAHQKRENAVATNKGAMQNGRLVVLVDESSASASEIVSGAIQDWDRGVIAGRRTFGKGLVQRPVPLPDGSMIRLTTARYYTPTGRSIQKPYENGNQASYNKDLIDRYNRGEMISADSIHFPDSLKFSTLENKRTVYGGGGIMPDYFVPVDTTRGSTLLRELNSNGITYKYTTQLIDAKRKAYKKQYPAFEDFDKKFVVTDQMINDLMDACKNDTAFNKDDSLPEDRIAKDLVKSGSVIKAQIKAMVARDIFGESEYHRVLNQVIDAYNKAIEIISDEKIYDKLLSGKIEN